MRCAGGWPSSGAGGTGSAASPPSAWLVACPSRPLYIQTCPLEGIPFSAFWLRSSVVSVLSSVITRLAHTCESMLLRRFFVRVQSARGLPRPQPLCDLGTALQPWSRTSHLYKVAKISTFLLLASKAEKKGCNPVPKTNLLLYKGHVAVPTQQHVLIPPRNQHGLAALAIMFHTIYMHMCANSMRIVMHVIYTSQAGKNMGVSMLQFPESSFHAPKKWIESKPSVFRD
eukprot:366088-Chlamydomonas_euryale.AAC.17